MKKMSIVLFFVLILGSTGAEKAHASLLQELGEELTEGNPPYPYMMGQPMDVLPQGSIVIGVGQETYYYDQGNRFYQMVMRIQKYVQVPPPIGAVVFSIPQGYEMMLIDGVSFYEYNGIFYRRVLEGYKVIYPIV